MLYYNLLVIKYSIALPLFYKVLRNKVCAEELEMYIKNDRCPFCGLLAVLWLFECFPEYRNVVFSRFSFREGYYKLV